MTATLPSVKSLKPAVHARIGVATPDDVIGQERKVGQDLQDWSGPLKLDAAHRFTLEPCSKSYHCLFEIRF